MTKGIGEKMTGIIQGNIIAFIQCLFIVITHISEELYFLFLTLDFTVVAFSTQHLQSVSLSAGTMQEEGMSPCTLPLPISILAEYFYNACSHSDMSVVLAGIASSLPDDWLMFNVWKEQLDNGVAGLQFGTPGMRRWVGVAGLPNDPGHLSSVV